ERKVKLEKLLKGIGRSRVVYSSHWTGDGARVFRQSCLNKMEGIVSKRADAPYTSGRGFSWQKIKCSNRQEVVIGGYTESEASGRPFGALLIGVYDGGKLRYVGRVGTGFSSELLGDLFKKMKKLEAKSSPFDKPPKEKGTVWLKPKLVAEVEYKTI